MLRARLKLEETLEFLEAAGLDLVALNVTSGDVINFGRDGTPNNVQIEPRAGAVPNMALMVDALSDDSVVNTGSFVALGVRMDPMLELTDANNLMKIANGSKDAGGKFIKSPTHPAPNYRVALELQGWIEPTEKASPRVIKVGEEPPPLARPTKPAGVPTIPVSACQTGEATPPPRIPQSLAGVLQPLPSGELVYHGNNLEQVLEAVRSQRLPYAAQLIERSLVDGAGDRAAIVEIRPNETTLRQTAVGDPGIRGVAYRSLPRSTS